MIETAAKIKSKPSTGIISEFADQSTTVGKTSDADNDSPSLKGKQAGLKTKRDFDMLTEVAEFPVSTFKNDFRNMRVLN